MDNIVDVAHYFGFGYVFVLAVWTILWEFLIRDLKGAKSNKVPTGGVGVIHVERGGTDDTDHLVVRLDRDYSHCSICYEAFTTDMESTDQTSQDLLPVMGPCGHYFCRGCIIASQYMVAPKMVQRDVQSAVERVNLILNISFLIEC